MPHPATQTRLEASIGHAFADPKLLELALTHSSFANESDAVHSYERLEFLGDAVLELCTSRELYNRFPTVREGQLTRLRSRLVKEKTLAQVARGVGLPDSLRLGRGEESQGGRERDALLADAMEALLGAVFLDGGYAAAETVIARLFHGLWPESAELPKAKDPKTLLQEAAQHLFKARPVYVQLGTAGPEHAKVYEVEVRLPDGRCFQALGGSLKKAEQHVAAMALKVLEADQAPD